MEMTEKKKVITEKQLEESPVQHKTNLIEDTSAPPLNLDMHAEDPDKNEDGLLTLTTQFQRRDNVTYSFRIPYELHKHFEKVAMEVSVEKGENINWQKLLIGAGLEKYPMVKKEKDEK